MSRPARLLASAVVAARTAAGRDAPPRPAPAAGARAARGAADTGAIPTAAPRAASGTLFQNFGTVRVVNAQKQPVKMRSVLFTHVSSATLKEVYENDFNDLNASDGILRASMPWSGGWVRADIKMPLPYSNAGGLRYVNLQIGDNEFEPFTAKRMPYVLATLKDAQTGALLAGGGLTVRRKVDNVVVAVVADNQTGDFDPAKGRIKAHYDYTGEVLVSETTLPYPYSAPANATEVRKAAYEAGTEVTWLHARFQTPG